LPVVSGEGQTVTDVQGDEYEAALAESGGDEEYALFPQNYRFQVPNGCHWRDVRAVTTNVGQALQKALRGIERANPETLYGIFGDAQWTNKERLSDVLLCDQVEHFARISLGNQAGQADILGQSYEYLIKKFADAANKKAGEFYPPRPVVRLMVNILDGGRWACRERADSSLGAGSSWSTQAHSQERRRGPSA
jgi:type I restriction enzyme M protein